MQVTKNQFCDNVLFMLYDINEEDLWKDYINVCKYFGERKSYPEIFNAKTLSIYCSINKQMRDYVDIFTKLGSIDYKKILQNNQYTVEFCRNNDMNTDIIDHLVSRMYLTTINNDHTFLQELFRMYIHAFLYRMGRSYDKSMKQYEIYRDIYHRFKVKPHDINLREHYNNIAKAYKEKYTTMIVLDKDVDSIIDDLMDKYKKDYKRNIEP